MRQGEYTYYTIQHRLTHQTEWRKPKGELKPVKDKEWGLSCFDWMGRIAQPWAGKGNNYKPTDKKASDQIHMVWERTGSKGWWDLDYAVKALARLMKANKEDGFMATDSYSAPHQSKRYEFRIVKITWFKKIEVASLTDAAKALDGDN